MVTNVTNEKWRAEKIKYLASFPQLNPNPIVETDSSGTVTFSNKATTNILKELGEKEEAKKFFPTDYKDILKALKEGKEESFQREVKIKSRTFLENISLLKKMGVARIYANDITDRKKIEEAHKANVEKYRVIVETANEGIITGSTDGKFTYVNQRWIDMLGYAREEMIGKIGLDFMDEDQRILVIKSRQNLDKGLTLRSEYKFRRKDGTALWTLASVTPLFDNNGKHIANVALHTDITDRKKTEEALRESQAKYKALTETTYDFVWEMDAQGRYTYCSPQIEKLWGIKPEEMVGKSPFEKMPPDARRQGAGMLLSYAKRRKSFHGIQMPSFDGHNNLVMIEVSGVPFFDNKGKLLGWRGITRDVTERIQAEKALQKARKLAEEKAKHLDLANKELESFNYSIAHDLKAPLRSINGFSTILYEEYADTLDEKGRRYLEKIQKSTMTMGELIDDLLRLSHISQSTLRLESVNITMLSKRIIETMREADPGREITVKIEKNLITHADARLLEVLLKNLLSNAWKFTVKTKHPFINIGKSSTEGKGVFFVQDNGVGFDPAHANKLFKPFERLHGTEYSGSGIGLAIVQRIINRHHGSIWAEGKIDKGATFYFTLGEKPS